MTVTIGSLSHHKDTGTTLVIEKTTLRDLVLEDLGDWLFGITCNLSADWTYRVRWGPVDEEYGIAERSLGSLLFTLSQKCPNLLGAYGRRKAVMTVPLTFAQVREHFPDAGWPWDGTTLEDDDKEAT